MIGFRDESETTAWILYTVICYFKDNDSGYSLVIFFILQVPFNCIVDKTLTFFDISKKEEKETEYETDQKAKNTRVRSYQGRIIL